MANTLVTVDQLARDASLLMSDRVRVARACSRTTEAQFANKVGDTVKVQVPAVLTANTFTSTTTTQNLNQTSENVTIEKHFEVTINLTSAERTLKLDDFNKQITIPAVNALQDSVEAYLLGKFHGLQLWSGTGGTAPSTVAHIVAGEKMLLDAKLRGEYFGLISTTTRQNLLQLPQFQSRDYASDNERTTVDGELGRRFGINWITHLSQSGFVRGDVAGTTLAHNEQAAGLKTLTLNGFTAATGTVYAGTHFTVTGSSATHVVTADTAISSNAAVLPIFPALTGTVANDAPVTFKAAQTDDFVMVGGAVAAAILPPAPLAVGSATFVGPGNIGMRVTSGTSTSSLSDTIVYDVLVGAKAVHRYAGGIWQA